MTVFDEIIAATVALPRVDKKAIAIGLDVGLCVLTVWLAFYLCLGERVSLSGQQWSAAALAIALALPIFVVAGLYRNVFRYVSGEPLPGIAQAVFAYGIIYSAIFTAFGLPGVPRSRSEEHT